MRHSILAVLVLAFMGAGTAAPATKPSSQPADLKADLLAAQAELQAAQARVAREFDESAAGKPLAADVAVKQAALASARADGSPQEKLDASAAFNRARKALEDGRAGALKTSKPVLEAQTKMAEVSSSIARADADEKAKARAARAAEEEREANDPIRIAIKTHQIIKGMTDDQMKQAMRFPLEAGKASWSAQRTISDDGAGNETSIWHIGYTSKYQTTFAEVRTVRVVSKDGIVAGVTQTRNELLDHEP